MKERKFKLDETVRLQRSQEVGEVIGWAEFRDRKPEYLIRYRDGNGVQVEVWWTESAVETI